MKKTTSNTFETILTLLKEKGITSKSALMNDRQLYNKFWFAAIDYARFASFSKNGGITKNGKQLKGNDEKIKELQEHGIVTRDEILLDVTIRIIEYSDTLLQLPTLNHQLNYAYRIVNTVVNTYFRKNPSFCISLNSIITENDTIERNAYTYEDIQADYSTEPSRLYEEKETIKEFKKELKERQAQMIAKKREDILHELEILSKHPARALARLAREYLGMKPRELANMLIEKECESVFTEILIAVSKKYGIDVADMRRILARREVTPESFKSDSNDVKTVSNQISHLVDRARKSLNP